MVQRKEIEMFGMLESLAKAATAVVTIPVAVVSDVVTMAIANKSTTYLPHLR